MKQINYTLDSVACSVNRLKFLTNGKQKQLLELIDKNPNTPCFIRAPKQAGAEDLINAYVRSKSDEKDVASISVDDDGLLSSSIDAQVLLVKELQWLDDPAAKQFSLKLDHLIDSGKQVIIVCTPQNDRYENLQSDRLLIDAQMLLNHSWLLSTDYARCINAFLEDFLPLEIRLLASLVTILGKTNLTELKELGYAFSADLPDLLASLNPLFSYQESNGSISVCEFRLQETALALCAVFSEHLQLQQDSVLQPECLEKLTKLSIHLLETGNLKRSHQVLASVEELITHSEAVNAGVNSGIKSIAANKTDSRPELLLQTYDTAPEPEQYSLDSSDQLQPAKLYIKLFGELEIYLNGVSLDNSQLHRNKIRRMVFMMATNLKKGVSRETLIDYLWPYLDFEHALTNLYTSWSFLGKGLGSENPKNCPYIERRGQLYRLNSNLVICDIQIFEELARQVLFGNLKLPEIVENIRQMELLYKNELISNTSADSYKKTCMIRFRALMVDSMMMAIKALKKQGEQAQALYFARSAHEIDTSREDVYCELMNVQFESGQRTSAMQTYFSCKRYLSDELGVLPSKKTTALYQELLLDRA